MRISNSVKVIHWLILLLSVMLTLFVWKLSKDQTHEKEKIRFDREADQVVNIIIERMQKYEEALWSGVSAIKMNDDKVSREEWKIFSENFAIEKKYPGINGIGVIFKVDEKNFTNFINSKKLEYPLFKPYPPHTIKDKWVITYIEPVKDNLKAVGLDMAHEENRYQAALRAEESGLAQVTGPISLVQDSKKTPGFLFYTPFYKKSDLETHKERRENIIGLVYAPFVMKKLMDGVLDEKYRPVSIAIRDKESILYNEVKDNTSSSRFITEKNIEIYGRVWSFKIQSNHLFEENFSQGQSQFILVTGFVIDILVFLLFVFLSHSNKRAMKFGAFMTSEYEKKVEDLKKINSELELENKERLKAERLAEEANIAKSSFLANMSHEIRTPLNGIIGLAELVSTEDIAVDIKDDITQIKKSSLSLLQLVNDILDLSKLNAGKVELEYKIFDIREVFNNSISLFKASVIYKNIELELDIDDDVPESFGGDSFRLRQIILNLIGNAIKFTDEGKISISVNVLKREGDLFKLQCEIVDTGIGIKEEAIGKLFNSFEQADNGINRKFGGTGLGLSITLSLIKLFNGEITVRSTEGQGSTFSFSFQLMMEKSVNVVDKISELENVNLSVIRVLLVEDNKVNQLVASRFLEKAGIQNISIAYNGEEAIKLAQNDIYDLILMDIQMPVLDGLSATEKIREFNKKVIIIGLSANAFKEDRDKAIRCGMNDYLEKPIKYSKLLKIIFKNVKV